MERAPTPRSSDEGPLVSVVTVNFNGAHLLGDLLRGLKRQTYRNHEVLVVDNDSTDGSLELLDREFPEVRVLRQNENYGFAGGNNAGIRAATGELVALVNNDTVPDPTWLDELVRAALEDPRIGAVASKIVFFRPFLPIRLHVEPPGTGALLGEGSAFAGCDYDKPIFKEGFGASEVVDGRPIRRLENGATLFLPVRNVEGPARLHLVVGSRVPSPGARLRVAVGSTSIATLDVAEELREHELYVPASVAREESFDVLNNAGTSLSHWGETADRGIYEPDRGQFDQPEDVDAVCGAAVLLRRSALDEVGLFDRDFFMYYEDVDLSWRLRSHGWRLRYEPRSTLRHLHATSSVEWSPLFTFYTARNRILMLAKNARARALLRAYAVEVRCIIALLLRALRERRRPTSRQVRRELVIRLRVHWSLLGRVPRALFARFRSRPS